MFYRSLTIPKSCGSETDCQIGITRRLKATKNAKGFQFTAPRQTGYSAFTAYGRQVNLLPDCRSQGFDVWR